MGKWCNNGFGLSNSLAVPASQQRRAETLGEEGGEGRQGDGADQLAQVKRRY